MVWVCSLFEEIRCVVCVFNVLTWYHQNDPSIWLKYIQVWLSFVKWSIFTWDMWELTWMMNCSSCWWWLNRGVQNYTNPVVSVHCYFFAKRNVKANTFVRTLFCICLVLMPSLVCKREILNESELPVTFCRFPFQMFPRNSH